MGHGNGYVYDATIAESTDAGANATTAADADSDADFYSATNGSVSANATNAHGSDFQRHGVKDSQEIEKAKKEESKECGHFKQQQQ